MRKTIKLFCLSFTLLLSGAPGIVLAQSQIDEKSVLSRFGFVKENSQLSQSAWYELDQKARRALAQGDISQAESDWLSALKLAESNNNVYPGVVNCLIGLSMLYHAKNNYGESDRIYELAMRNMEGLVGRSSVEYAKQLPDLAWLYLKHGKPDKAEYILKQAVKTNETAFGSKSKQHMESLKEYADFLTSANRSSEASLLELQIKKIEEHLSESQKASQSDSGNSNDGN